MKSRLIICLCSLVCSGISLAEPRTFTNKEGKEITAELIGVEDQEAVLKLANASRAKVPLSSLSDSDQEFIKSWWEENKNKVGEMDVRLEIEKDTKRVSKADSGGAKGKGAKKKASTDEVQFTCVLKSYTKKDLSNIKADYTIYKRVSTRGKEGSGTTTEEIDGSTSIPSLPSHQSAEFQTDSIKCEDFSEKGKEGTNSKRETVIGFVVTLSAGGEEFLKQGYPDNFLDRLKEEEEREEREKNK